MGRTGWQDPADIKNPLTFSGFLIQTKVLVRFHYNKMGELAGGTWLMGIWYCINPPPNYSRHQTQNMLSLNKYKSKTLRGNGELEKRLEIAQKP
jgi:hypothetical protein